MIVDPARFRFDLAAVVQRLEVEELRRHRPAAEYPRRCHAP